MVIHDVLNDHRVCDRLLYLKERWKDESQYEDLNDYKENFQKVVPPGVKVVGVRGRPFSMGIQLPGEQKTWEVRVKTKGNRYSLIARPSK